MPTVAYATLAPTNDAVTYNNTAMFYPDASVADTFGTILAPKLYAKDVDVLELASSGKVALTLADEHAVDMSRTGRDVYIAGRNGNSLHLASAGATAAANFNTSGKIEITLNSAQLLDLSADATDAFVTAKLGRKLDLVSASNDVNVTAASNVNVTAQAGSVHTAVIQSQHVGFNVGTSEDVGKFWYNSAEPVAGMKYQLSVKAIVADSGFKSSQIDKNTIRLGGYPGEDTADASASNDGAGLVVSGHPAGVTTHLERYEKSIRWHKGNVGMAQLGTKGGFSNESYWDVSGGALRMSHTNATTGSKMAYQFRVNDKDEFELVRVYDSVNAAGPVYDVVAKFGLKNGGAGAIASGLDAPAAPASPAIYEFAAYCDNSRQERRLLPTGLIAEVSGAMTIGYVLSPTIMTLSQAQTALAYSNVGFEYSDVDVKRDPSSILTGISGTPVNLESLGQKAGDILGEGQFAGLWTSKYWTGTGYAYVTESTPGLYPHLVVTAPLLTDAIFSVGPVIPSSIFSDDTPAWFLGEVDESSLGRSLDGKKINSMYAQHASNFRVFTFLALDWNAYAHESIDGRIHSPDYVTETLVQVDEPTVYTRIPEQVLKAFYLDAPDTWTALPADPADVAALNLILVSMTVDTSLNTSTTTFTYNSIPTRILADIGTLPTGAQEATSAVVIVGSETYTCSVAAPAQYGSVSGMFGYGFYRSFASTFDLGTGQYLGTIVTNTSTGPVNGPWIQMSCSAAKAITTYGWTYGSSDGPKAWTLVASDTGADGTWVVLGTQSVPWPTIVHNAVHYTVSNITSYSHYRLVITATAEDTAGQRQGTLWIDGPFYFY